MKKLTVVAAILAMAAGISVSANAAYDPEWVILLNCSSRSDVIQNSGGWCVCQTTFDGTDALGDSYDVPIPPQIDDLPIAYPCVVDTDTGKHYYKDAKSPFEGRTKTWNLQILATSAYPEYGGNRTYLYLWNPTSSSDSGAGDFAPLGGETIKLYKVLNDFGGPRELLWTVDPNHNGTGDSSDPYTYKDCFDVGTKFQLEMSTVPEPSSILSLFCGLGGLSAVIRRKTSK